MIDTQRGLWHSSFPLETKGIKNPQTKKDLDKKLFSQTEADVGPTK